MADTTKTEAFLGAHGITQTEAGLLLGISGSAVSRKLSGARQWHLEEMHRFLDALAPRLGHRPSLDEVFGRDQLELPEPDAVDMPVATVATGPEAA